MLYRKAYDELIQWKARGGKSSLLIEGARRVGKTTLAKKFAKENYRSSIYIDFSKPSREVKGIFESQGDDVDSFLSYLSILTGTTLYPRESLIIFDEVQRYPQARGFLKHLVEHGQFDYVATGSLLSIKQNVDEILIPSEEEALELNPLDFEEYLIAAGERELARFLEETSRNPKVIIEGVHKKAMMHFREYMLVGGMPQAVEEYLANKDFHKVDRVKRNILRLYRNDIARFAKGYESKVISIFEGIPSQLAMKEKGFTLASISKNARMRDYEEAFFWLDDARVVNTCFNSREPSVGLGLNEDRVTLKCYMADTGLLVTHAFASRKDTDDSIYRAILFDNIGINEGMILENMVAQIFRASGRKLYYYSRRDQNNRENTMEIDFLIIRDEGVKPKVSPVEVKSSKRYSVRSLEKFRKKFGSRIGDEIVLHPGNVSIDANRIKLPLYLAPWL